MKNNTSVANMPVKIRAASKSFSPFITGVKPPITIAANASLAKSKKKPAIFSLTLKSRSILSFLSALAASNLLIRFYIHAAKS